MTIRTRKRARQAQRQPARLLPEDRHVPCPFEEPEEHEAWCARTVHRLFPHLFPEPPLSEAALRDKARHYAFMAGWLRPLFPEAVDTSFAEGENQRIALGRVGL